LNLERFYEDMLKEFSRILKKDGILVILTAQKELLEIILSKFPDQFLLIKRLDTLVSGQKAGAFKIKRVTG
jgi:ubiquinone/menaquinone biosynthesis C-methylase UbiE